MVVITELILAFADKKNKDQKTLKYKSRQG